MSKKETEHCQPNDDLFSWTYVGNSTSQHVILDFNMTKGITTLCHKLFKTKTVVYKPENKQCVGCLKEVNKCKKAFGWMPK